MKKLHTAKPFAIPVLTIVLAIAVVVLAVQVRQLRHDTNGLKQQSQQSGLLQLRSLIESAVSGLETPAPVDAKTGVVYFSELGLMLPPVPSSIGGLEYSYQPGDGKGINAELHVSSVAALNSARANLASGASQKAMFAAVPRLQACARGVTIAFAPESGRKDALPPKDLSNGKTLYFYSEAHCPSNDLVQYLGQIQLY